MTSDIEKDNNKQMLRFKAFPPHPSYIAGVIDGDGCIFIRKISDGYQSGFTLTQCRTNILQILRYHFGGSITSSTNRNDKTENIMDENNEYFHKYNIRNQYNLLIRSNEYQVLLEYLHNSFIIKEQQYRCLYEFNKITNLPNKVEPKEELHLLCSQCNEKCILNENNLSRLNIEYISGLFDAEGCVFIDKKFNHLAIKMSQKNHPLILYEIQKYLKFGKVYSHEFIIYNKSDCLKFIQLVKDHLIVKYNQAIAFETYLETEDPLIKTEMYKICNEEKHKIENFTDLNQNETGKDGYLETIRLRELKHNVCNQIKLKQIYKEKSEKMKGEGNHNFGKTFTEEHKKKMSLSIRDSKNGVSDEIIKKVRELLQLGHKNIEIQQSMGLPRHTITRIKNGIVSCRDEERHEITSLTREEVNLSKRKIQPNEIIMAVEKFIEGWKPMNILDYLTEERNKNAIPNTLTIDIVKNIKRNIKNNKRILYETEVADEQYIHFMELLKRCKEII